MRTQRLFVVASSVVASRHNPDDETAYNHLDRLLLPRGDPWWIRWRSYFDRVEEVGRTPDTAGPLGQSAELFGHLYPVRRLSFALSCLVLVMLVFTVSITGFSSRYFVIASAHSVAITPLVVPPDLLPAKLRASRVHKGSSGGGARETLPASRGKLPKPALEQFTPSRVDPQPAKLPMEPTLIAPPDIKVANLNLLSFGDSLAKLGPPSNGPGSGGGIGAGRGGGVGNGSGPGYPSTKKAGAAGSVMAGGGVIPPRAVKCPPPAYTTEAYEAKLEGKVVLQVLVGIDGKARILRVVSGLPMGLNQAAIEAVQKWTFEAGRRGGQAIGMEATVTIYFHL